jgi:hypothetical protein
MGREPHVLASGKQFHHQVQLAFVAGLLGLVATDVVEQWVIRPSGVRERADLLFVAPDDVRTRVVIEIKSTIWHVRPAPRRRALLLRHLRQLDGYLDVLLEDLGSAFDSVVGVLLYRARPPDEIVAELEAVALPRGIMIALYDDMDWRSG